MDNAPTTPRPRGMRTTPPRMTGAEIRALGRLRVTLTKGELEDMAHLVAAGRVLLRDSRPISRNLRTAMTKLGIDTRGL